MNWYLTHRRVKYPVRSLKAAQKKYDQLRDKSLEGASTWQDGTITNDEGVRYRISYNGRVWNGMTEVKV